MLNEKPLLNVSEAAAIMSVKPATVRNWINGAFIRATKLSNQWRISRHDLKRFMEQNGNMAPVDV